MSIMNKAAQALSHVKNAKKDEIIAKKLDLGIANDAWAAGHAADLTTFGVNELAARTESKSKTDQARTAMIAATNAAADAVVNDNDLLDKDSIYDLDQEIKQNKELFDKQVNEAEEEAAVAREDLRVRIGDAEDFNASIAAGYSIVVMV